VIRVEERVENITTHLLGSIASLMENATLRPLIETGTKFLKETKSVDAVLCGTDEGNTDEIKAFPTIGV